MARPRGGLDDYLEWQQRLESQKESGLSIEVFCLQEGVSKSTFFRWARQLHDGIPDSLNEEQTEREKAETGEAVFLPITLKASPVEIELPNGGVVRPPVAVCVARGKQSETMFGARILLPQAQTGIAGRWVLAKRCWWKSFELRGPCVPGGHRSHDELLRRSNLLLHDAHEDELQLRSLDGSGGSDL